MSRAFGPALFDFVETFAEEVTDTLVLALEAAGCASAHVLHKPRLLSDNGPSYVAGEWADNLANKNMRHARGAPFDPQT